MLVDFIARGSVAVCGCVGPRPGTRQPTGKLKSPARICDTCISLVCNFSASVVGAARGLEAPSVLKYTPREDDSRHELRDYKSNKLGHVSCNVVAARVGARVSGSKPVVTLESM